MQRKYPIFLVTFFVVVEMLFASAASSVPENKYTKSRDIIVIGEVTGYELVENQSEVAIFTVTIYNTVRNRKNRKEAKPLGQISFKALS